MGRSRPPRGGRSRFNRTTQMGVTVEEWARVEETRAAWEAQQTPPKASEQQSDAAAGTAVARLGLVRRLVVAPNSGLDSQLSRLRDQLSRHLSGGLASVASTASIHLPVLSAEVIDLIASQYKVDPAVVAAKARAALGSAADQDLGALVKKAKRVPAWNPHGRTLFRSIGVQVEGPAHMAEADTMMAYIQCDYPSLRLGSLITGVVTLAVSSDRVFTSAQTSKGMTAINQAFPPGTALPFGPVVEA